MALFKNHEPPFIFAIYIHLPVKFVETNGTSGCLLPADLMTNTCINGSLRWYDPNPNLNPVNSSKNVAIPLMSMKRPAKKYWK